MLIGNLFAMTLLTYAAIILAAFFAGSIATGIAYVVPGLVVAHFSKDLGPYVAWKLIGLGVAPILGIVAGVMAYQGMAARFLP